MSTSSQYLSVPQLNHRPSQHRNDRGPRRPAQSSRAHHQSVAAEHAASSSKVKLEDTPLGTHAPLGVPVPTQASPVQTARTFPPTSASSPQATLLSHTPPSPRSSTSQLSPRSIFRAMPFLIRLRSPRSDLLSLSCNSGAPRTHPVLGRSQLHKAPQSLTYSRTLVCADAVNADVLLRFARNELFERAQQANRHVTALVDEEWQYTVQQTKSGDYNVQVSYSACPAQCKSTTADPRKPIALSHVTNIPGLMRIIPSE
ncbi:hypothetical protein EDB92DRAFT_1942350 [Lactarius akahatsu]|uniref:Uncharacterized protein n=1 Tax=Lactarius akahatsu TaxID=416441 RepID=A0AAD4QG57_9AGAM|nr:hypothetical protein EDB92DRAFT_1942350 [Lactarius akahatsu]